MAARNKKATFGNRRVRMQAMKAGTRGTAGKMSHADDAKDHLVHAGDGKTGRTIWEKAHPSHPGEEFVAPRGRGQGSQHVPDHELMAPYTKKKPKAK